MVSTITSPGYFAFIKKVENFYEKAGKRILPEDKMEREGYLAFWREWDDLKERATYAVDQISL